MNFSFQHRYKISDIQEFGIHNPAYDNVVGRVCYPAYIVKGERGLFLIDSDDGTIPHRFLTSPIADVFCGESEILIRTQTQV